MGLFSWIILGLIAGFIASKIVNRTGSGLILDLVLGMVGGRRLHLLRAIWDERGHRPQHLEHHRLGDWRGYRAVDLREADRENLTGNHSLLPGPGWPGRLICPPNAPELWRLAHEIPTSRDLVVTQMLDDVRRLIAEHRAQKLMRELNC